MEVYSDSNKPDLRLLSALLLCVFGGAIVGETSSLSLLISYSGSGVLGRLYLLNGLLLLGLPLLFFRNIDRFPRERILGALLLSVTFILMVYLAVLMAGVRSPWLLWAGYLIAYLSKTTLFLTFWTLANDVCTAAEAKKSFPRIAAWGFVGGIAGSLAALALIKMARIATLVGLWATLYALGYVVLVKMRSQYSQRFWQIERAQPVREPLSGLIKDVWALGLVRSLAVLYLLVFISIFLIDFLFWKYCNAWFPEPDTLATFQFSFYLVHSLTTVAALGLVMPRLIYAWGFTQILFILPMALGLGSALILGMNLAGVGPALIFSALIIVQFTRYVVFENAFSPIYQLFFFAVPESKRGRAKTVLDGVVKPAAIVIAGLVLLVGGSWHEIILVIILVLSLLMGISVFATRKRYVVDIFGHPGLKKSRDITITMSGGHSRDKHIDLLLGDFLLSPDEDLRALAVTILSRAGTREALKKLRSLYVAETSARVREIVARSLDPFYWFETRAFIEELFKDPNPRVRANAIHSLNRMNCHWKWQLKDIVKSLLFENSLRIQIESARFLWQSGDAWEQSNIRSFCMHLVGSSNSNKRSAGLYLVGLFRLQGWEQILIKHLESSSLQVFSKSLQSLLEGGGIEIRLTALKRVENLDREHIRCAGKCLENLKGEGVQTIEAFLPVASTRRMFFECVQKLRHIRMAIHAQFPLPAQLRALIHRWILKEIKIVYRDILVWDTCKKGMGRQAGHSSVALLESALIERNKRVSQWTIDAISLTEKEGLVKWGSQELNLVDEEIRPGIIELLESLGNNRLAALVLPLLKGESWRQLSRHSLRLFRTEVIKGPFGFEHFAYSENRWISVCALYVLSQTGVDQGELARFRPVLEKLESDAHAKFRPAAMALRSKFEKQGVEAVESFDLLETVLFLKQTVLFGSITGERLMEVAEICELKSFEADTILSREGDVSDHLYIVRRGRIRVVKKGQSGEEVELGMIDSGQTYGELGLFHQSVRSASAIAAEPCVLYVIQRSRFKKLLMNVPEIAYNFLDVLAGKLLRANQETSGN